MVASRGSLCLKSPAGGQVQSAERLVNSKRRQATREVRVACNVKEPLSCESSDDSRYQPLLFRQQLMEQKTSLTYSQASSPLNNG